MLDPFRIIGSCFALVMIAGGAHAQESAITTSMNEITKIYEIKACKQRLEQLTADLVGVKHHRINVYSPKGDQHLFDAFMYLEFNDRPAHVNFSARADAAGNCEADYNMTFYVDIPCVEARDEILGKFEILGALSKNVFVYGNNKHHPSLTAVSTPLRHDRACLITYKFNESKGQE